MSQRKQTTEIMQEKLKEKPFYGNAIKIVEKFLGEQKEDREKESIKINPYAEHPWEVYPELVSSRWADTASEI